MKTIDKYERVAALALRAHKDVSAHTIAATTMLLSNLARKTRRLGEAIINGVIAPDAGYEKMAKLLETANVVAAAIGPYSVTESDDGTGYLTILAKGAGDYGITGFGAE